MAYTEAQEGVRERPNTKDKDKESEQPASREASFSRRTVNFTAPDKGLAPKREEDGKGHGNDVKDVKAQATVYVIITCIVSASGGFLFGYDGGVSGGVSVMPDFQAKFFPAQLKGEDRTYYCRHNDPILQLFSSVMYFCGAASSLPGAHLSKMYGRTMTMTLAGMAFLIGSIILAAAPRTPMLVLGRIFWGIGVGLADQAVTIYSAEMAPPHLRGTLNMLFQLCVVTGILIAQTINLGTHYLTWGWRLSLGLAALPGLFLLVGGLYLAETPNSLVERGYLQRGRAVLEDIRGTADVDAEYGTIIYAQQREKASGINQWRSVLKREVRPHLILSIALPFFQMWTGINAIVAFSPFIFQGLGTRFTGETGSLLATMIVGAVQVAGNIIGLFLVDRVGRRKILIQASIQTFIAELTLGIVFALSVGVDDKMLTGTPAIASIVLICVFVSAFGWGWGPLAWVISSEIQPLETRSVGQGITVLVQLVSGAIVNQCFLSMLCTMKYGVYLLFGTMQLLATLFVYFFLPETTGIPIERVHDVFRVHWYWKRFYADAESKEASVKKEIAEVLQRRSTRILTQQAPLPRAH